METHYEKRTVYKINIQGPLDHFSAIWNGDISILRSDKDVTLLACRLLDQAALRGLLNHLWNLNFTILSIERIENADDDFPLFPQKGESNHE